MVILEDYDAVKVNRPLMNSVKFFIPMERADDIILADLATEITQYDGNLMYDHIHYITTTGVKKYMDPVTGCWSAVIEAERK